MKLKHLSKEDWQNLAEYIGEIKAGLELYNWSINLQHAPCSKKHAGTISPIYGRYYATLNLSRYWPKYSAYEQKHTIIHELLHLYFFDTQSAIGRLENIAPEDVYGLIWSEHTERLEYAIDMLASTLCKQFPDPPPINGVEL